MDHPAKMCLSHFCKQRGATSDKVGKRFSRPGFGRFFVAGLCRFIRGGDTLTLTGKIEIKDLPRDTRFLLRSGFGLLTLLLCFFGTPLLDHLAHAARMLAVESLAQRFGEGSITGIADYHPRPSDSLKNSPMSTERKTHRYHDPPATSAGYCDTPSVYKAAAGTHWSLKFMGS